MNHPWLKEPSFCIQNVAEVILTILKEVSGDQEETLEYVGASYYFMGCLCGVDSK